jgi:hypothetical protein
MRKLLFILAILVPAAISFAKTPDTVSPYSQLIGFMGGGEFYPATQMSAWSGGVFFENVIDPLFGVQIELIRADVPVTNYVPSTGVTNFGVGTRSFVEINAALKIYINRFSLYGGLSYDDYINGNIVYNNNTSYADLRNSGNNYLSTYFGADLVAQISGDLFTKVGVRFVYGILTPYFVNPNTGIRFIVSFAYGI